MSSSKKHSKKHSQTPEEIEAITIMDRRSDDEQANFFANPISIVLKQANELTYLSTRLINK